MNINDKIFDDFRETLISLIKKYSKESLPQNMEYVYDGVVVAVSEDNKSASVDIGYDTIKGILNKSGETLYISDKVRVYTKNNELNSSFIGVKLS